MHLISWANTGSESFLSATNTLPWQTPPPPEPCLICPSHLSVWAAWLTVVDSFIHSFKPNFPPFPSYPFLPEHNHPPITPFPTPHFSHPNVLHVARWTTTMYTPPRCDLGFATTIVDPTVGAAGAAALCAALTHWLGRPPARSPEGEVASEVVGWALLAVLLNTKRWRRCAAEGTGVGDDGSGEGLLGLSGGVASKGGKGWAVWAVAAGVAGACCYRAEVGSVGLFVSGDSRDRGIWVGVTC